MQTQTHSEEQGTQTNTQADLGELAFSDYERVRRGEKLEESATQSSALAAASAEQKKSSKSDSEETEAKEDQAGETDAEDSDEELDAKDSDQDKPKKKGGFQRRIDKLNARYTAAQQEVEYWKQQALKGAGSDQKPETKVETPKEAKSDGEPNPDAFDSHAEYVEALTDWKIEQKEKAAKEQARKSELETEQQKLMQSHHNRVKAFAEKTPDFRDVVNEALADGADLSPTIESLIVGSDNGPEILYALVKDREELDRLNKLGPIAAARELGRFESKLTAKSQQATEEKPKKLTTEAPKPIAPVGGTKTTVTKNPEEMSYQEYERHRREQLKRKG
jgi:hypothetical protein